MLLDRSPGNNQTVPLTHVKENHEAADYYFNNRSLWY
jgi:hypothetical protein